MASDKTITALRRASAIAAVNSDCAEVIRSGVSAVCVVRDIDQPVHVDRRAVTFWHELPPHKYGTTADVAAVLRELHKLSPPEVFDLPGLAPFVRLAQRIEDANTISEDDQNWLLDRLAELKAATVTCHQGCPDVSYTVMRGVETS